MDEKRLEEIEARAKAATPGPWTIFARSKRAVRAIWLTRLNRDGDSVWTWPGFVQTSFEHDADFIAHARQDIPDLLAEIERLQAKNEELAIGIIHLQGND